MNFSQKSEGQSAVSLLSSRSTSRTDTEKSETIFKLYSCKPYNFHYLVQFAFQALHRLSEAHVVFVEFELTNCQISHAPLLAGVH